MWVYVLAETGSTNGRTTNKLTLAVKSKWHQEAALVVKFVLNVCYGRDIFRLCPMIINVTKGCFFKWRRRESYFYVLQISNYSLPDYVNLTLEESKNVWTHQIHDMYIPECKFSKFYDSVLYIYSKCSFYNSRFFPPFFKNLIYARFENPSKIFIFRCASLKITYLKNLELYNILKIIAISLIYEFTSPTCLPV